jgi:alkaline phosphatase
MIPPMVYFAVVTDIHYGFDKGNKKGSRAPVLIDRFIKAANTNRVDFAVELGDRVIATADAAQDEHYQQKLSEHFNKLAMPLYSVDGNHDVWHRPNRPSSAVRHGDVTLVLWNPDVRIWKYIDKNDPDGPPKIRSLHATPEDLQWLKDALAAAETPCIVFSHVPLDNQAKDDANALARDKYPNFSYYPQGAEIRKILEDSGKVRQCFHGHRHRNRHREINGIHYFTLQSLVQRNENTGHVRGAFYMVKIDENEIRVKGYGPGQKSYAIPLTEKSLPEKSLPPAPVAPGPSMPGPSMPSPVTPGPAPEA